jgi:hypothetical protein
MWKCLDCKKQFSIKVGTIFEDSPIGLDKWLCAMFLIANCKNGVSSYEIARDIHAFRFNKRHTTDADRFAQLCSNVAGKRLTWNQLTGEDDLSRPVRDEARESITEF